MNFFMIDRDGDFWYNCVYDITYDKNRGDMVSLRYGMGIHYQSLSYDSKITILKIEF